MKNWIRNLEHFWTSPAREAFWTKDNTHWLAWSVKFLFAVNRLHVLLLDFQKKKKLIDSFNFFLSLIKKIQSSVPRYGLWDFLKSQPPCLDTKTSFFWLFHWIRSPQTSTSFAKEWFQINCLSFLNFPLSLIGLISQDEGSGSDFRDEVFLPNYWEFILTPSPQKRTILFKRL